jgi:hypothetical protein
MIRRESAFSLGRDNLGTKSFPLIAHQYGIDLVALRLSGERVKSARSPLVGMQINKTITQADIDERLPRRTNWTNVEIAHQYDRFTLLYFSNPLSY